MKKRKKFVVRVFMLIEGKEVMIDPQNTNLPDRCKLAFAEMTTGQKHEFVKG